VSRQDEAWLVDSSRSVFRAWHSLPDEFQDHEGWPVNAVHGFTRFVLELLEKHRPPRLVFAFDAALESNFRNAIYPAYKANRESAPPELKRQFAWCQQLVRALGFPVLADANYEADDLIGSALQVLRQAGLRNRIISADKDLSQLLAGEDEQWDYARSERWNVHGCKARYGVHAHQVADYLGLTGDAIDNIPGVPGIGAKTAASLLEHFGSLDVLLERLAEVPYLRSLRGSAAHATRLQANRELALLSRRLATIACDAPLPEDFNDGARKPIDQVALDALVTQLRFGPLTRRRLLVACGAMEAA
jgi:5'-3' exonuclease